MKKIFLFLTIFYVLNSCSENHKAENYELANSPDSLSKTKKLNQDSLSKRDDIQVEELNSETSINIDTISDRTFNGIDTSLKQGTPSITSLPFPPNKKMSSNSYIDLIGKDVIGGIPKYTPTYKLPPIDKVKFIAIDSANEMHFCARNIPIDSLLKINKYKYKLPDCGMIEVYYMCNDSRLHDFTPAFERYCNFHYQYYGHLILYNKNSKEAKVLTIYYSRYTDAYGERNFYIDKDYNIYLKDWMVTDGENGVDPPSTTGQYEINIKNDGAIKIKNLLK